MIGTRLHSIDIRNFRSLTAAEEIRLDAPVVLIHGPNGAGKTSFLSAIELALTGEIASMQRVDRDYKKHLLRDGTDMGHILLKVADENASVFRESQVILSGGTVRCEGKLDGALAQFFSERCFLAQSSLTQLLTIYQQPGTGIDSPLAAFVRELLGLDRLDAIERGLEAAMDVRNTRKVVPSLVTAERNRDALTQERLRAQGKADAATATVDSALTELTTSLTHLKINVPPDLDEIQEFTLDPDRDRSQLSELLDAEQQLSAIERQHVVLATLKASAERSAVENELSSAEGQYSAWQTEFGQEIIALIANAANLNLVTSLPESQVGDQLPALESAWAQEATRLDGLIVADEKINKTLREKEDARTGVQGRLLNLDAQISQVSSDVGLLAQALSGILPHIHTSECPVCRRDYDEVSKDSLAHALAVRIEQLGDAAERQKYLTGERVTLERERLALEREIGTLRSQVLAPASLQELQSRAADVQQVLQKAKRLAPHSVVGGIMLARAVAARQVFDRLISSSSEEAAIRQEAIAVAKTVAVSSDLSEPVSAILGRAKEALAGHLSWLRETIEVKTKAQAHHKIYRKALEVKVAAVAELTSANAAEKVANNALNAADETRKAMRKLVGVVGAARSEVIGRVFNERLNLIWRDLFVRLAPFEPFVPAFFPPSPGTRATAPTLKTAKRAGGHGGAPGTMLSAGNLNTAALTLFLALHLAVQRKLPWLILDDPVQSMDEVHISQFAALLRTLSKESGRQIFITVHEKALFDYLTLELSPAFEGDQLITLEISPSSEGVTRIIPKRIFYRLDNAIVPVAAE